MTESRLYTPEIESILADLEPEERVLAVEAFERAAADGGSVYQDPSFRATAMKLCAERAKRVLRSMTETSTRSTAPKAESTLYGPAAERTALAARHLTDDGNALRLVDLHGGDLRHVHEWGWVCYDGRRWNRDSTHEVERRARETVGAMYGEAASEADPQRRTNLGGHAVRSEAAARIAAIVDLAESDARVQARPEDFDRDPDLLNVANGTIDLRTGTLHPHRRENLITKLAPIDYDPDAKCPRFLRFMDEVFAGNPRLIGFVQRAAGYSLTGHVRERALILCHGGGTNGKSTLLTTLKTVAGDYGHQASPQLFMAHRNAGGPRDGIAQLCGKRLVIAVEPDEGGRLNVALVKWLTGGDTLRGSFLYHNSFEFQPTHTPWLAANHKPAIRETTDAIWERIYLVPFNVSFKGREDKTLQEVFLEESPGILAWKIRGCLEWQKIGLAPPAEVIAATKTYRDESDDLHEFLDARCVFEANAKVTAKDLRAEYEVWCAQEGEKPLSTKDVGKLLVDLGCTPGKGTPRRWTGIRLFTPEEIRAREDGGVGGAAK